MARALTRLCVAWLVMATVVWFHAKPVFAQTTVQTNQRWEAAFTSARTYANPFKDVTVTVEYTKPGSATIRSMAFWDGGNTFTIRMAFPETGLWTYRTTSSDPANTGLHNQTGTVQVTAYTGTNPLYQHGFLRVSADKRSLEHADGSPFFWLGDTLWGATVWLSESGFRQAINDLVAKKFTVLLTNFTRKAEVDTTGMVPYDNASGRWNVAFMQRLDRAFNYANDQGIFLFLNGLIDLKWDRGIQDWDRLVRMIAVRYAGHFVSWSSSMDDPYSAEQDAVGQAIEAVDNRPLLTQHVGSDSVDPACNPSLHSNVCGAQLYQSQSYVDYTMLESGRGSLTIIEGINWLYNFSPTKPIVNGEAGYEEVDATAEHTTRMAYFTLLAGACGHSHGTIYWDADDSDIAAWAALPGRTYLSYLAPFWRAIDGGRALIPRAELVTNQASSYDEKKLVAVTQSGAKYVAYLPVGGTISMNLSAVSGQLAVSWFDPLSGNTLGNSTAQGGGVRSFTSPLGSRQSVLVLSSGGGGGTPGSLQLSADTYSVVENGGTAPITLTRTDGSAGAVSVTVATSSGTATAGADYTATTQTVSFANGDTAPKTVTIPILNDTLVEANETVNLTLQTPTGGATLGTPSTAVLTIIDNDTGPTLSASPTTVAAGGTVTATWAGMASPTPTDWLGLYTPGASNTVYLAWRYTTGTASGNVAFSMPSTITPGTYEVRLFSNNAFTRLATSNTFTVTSGGGGVTLSVNPTSVAAGGTVTATWAGMASPTPTDWLGLYTPGASNTVYLAWRYTPGTASGNVAFSMPSTITPGTYEVRLFSNNAFTRLATSNTFTVTSGGGGVTLSVNPTSVAAGGTVTATWSGIATPTPRDWLGLYTLSAPNTGFLAWIYVSCTPSPGSVRAAGSCAFPVPATLAAGTYHLRLFANDGFTVLATTAP